MSVASSLLAALDMVIVLEIVLVNLVGCLNVGAKDKVTADSLIYMLLYLSLPSVPGSSN